MRFPGARIGRFYFNYANNPVRPENIMRDVEGDPWAIVTTPAYLS